MSRTEEIRHRLQECFQPTYLEVEDDSARHAGHAAMRGLSGGQTHYNIVIAAEAFRGKSRVERHRMVNDALKDLFSEGLHAVAIKADASGGN